MTSTLESFKKQLSEAAVAAELPHDAFHDTARKVVNIERQCFYGNESPARRLSRIRETIDQAIKQGDGKSEI
ncbi:MAG: hypothetical protein WBC41_04400 [Pseudoalteromonas nigrifaciens]|uniref:hypothetical protein n=1 Tax=Pseudoalteromonas nigrifaciens TaxID=28109 RepID=UPI003C728B2D